jgi:RNA polymerase sigma-70 factor (ECF subfamily)
MHPRSEADQELVGRVARSDPDALDEIYGRYSRSVYGLVYRILGDPSSAEDVVQEVFLKLWRQPVSYNAERGSLGSWLLGVGHNRAIDVLRRRRTHQEQPLPEAGEPEIVPDGYVDMADTVGVREASDAVHRALTHIPVEQRRVIEMAFFEGKTHVEIAEELGEPLGTAKTRIRLGMRKLRALLEAEGVVTRLNDAS